MNGLFTFNVQKQRRKKNNKKIQAGIIVTRLKQKKMTLFRMQFIISPLNVYEQCNKLKKSSTLKKKKKNVE